MYPNDPAKIKQLAESAAVLLNRADEWVIRRKENVTFVDETLVRRRMSVDFELPPWVEPIHETRDQEPVFYAPLFLLQKGSDDLPEPGRVMVEPPPHFAAFDVRNGSGEAMSLPPRVWNATVSIEALKVATRMAAQEGRITVGATQWIWLEVLYEYICRKERNEAVQMLIELKHAPVDTLKPRHLLLRLLLEKAPTLDWMLEACSKSSVAMVPLVGSRATQGVVKISYNEQIARFGGLKNLADRRGRRALAKLAGSRIGWSGYDVWIDTPFIGAGSYHVEVVAPVGLEAYDAGLFEVPEDPEKIEQLDRIPHLSRVSGLAGEVHLYTPDAGRKRGALSWVRLRVRRDEFLTTAAVVSFMIAGILWVANSATAEIKASPRGVPALLLLFPGAVAAYLARPVAHRLTTRILTVARTIMVLVAALPYVAAVSLALAQHDSSGQITSDSFKGWIFWLAVAASTGFVALLATRFLPQPTIRWQRAAKRFGWVWTKHHLLRPTRAWFVRRRKRRT